MSKHGARAVPEPVTSAAAFALSGGQPADVRQRLIADLEPRQGRHQGRRLLAAAEPTVPGPAGDRIARLALTALRDAFEHASEDSTPLALGRAFAVADAVVRTRNRLYEAGVEAPRILVGITAAVVEGRIVTIAQVPPHRAILVQDGRCYPLPGSDWADGALAGEDDEVESYPLGSDEPVAPRLVRSATTGDDLLILADSCLIDRLGQEGRRLGPGDRAVARDVDRTLAWMEGLTWRHALDDVMGACLTLPVSGGASPSQERPRAPWLVTPLNQSEVSSLSAIAAVPGDEAKPAGTGPTSEVPPVEGDPAAGVDASAHHGQSIVDAGREGNDNAPATGNESATSDHPSEATRIGSTQPLLLEHRYGEATHVPLLADQLSEPGAESGPPRPGDPVRETMGHSFTTVRSRPSDGVDEDGAGLPPDAERWADTLAVAAEWWDAAESPDGRAAKRSRDPIVITAPAPAPDGPDPSRTSRVRDIASGFVPRQRESGDGPRTIPEPGAGSARDGGEDRHARGTLRVVTGPRGRASFFPSGLSALPAGPPHRRRVGSLTRLALVALALSLICGSSAVAHDRVTDRDARAHASQEAISRLDAAIAAIGSETGTAPAQIETADRAMTRAEDAGIAEASLVPRRQRLRQLADAASGVVRLGNVSQVGRLPVEVTGDASVPPRLVRVDRELYLVANGLYRVSLSDSRLVAALAPGSEIDGRVVGALTDGAWNTSGLVVTDGGAAYRLEGDEWSVHPLPDMPSTGQRGPCATLDSGFYVLDASDGTIMKSDFEEGNGTLSAWTPAGQTPSLRGAKSVVIDGRIHVLRADGTVATLETGEIVAERTLPVEPPVSEPIMMTGGLDSTVLWVLDHVGEELRVIRTDPDTGDTRAFLFDTPLGERDILAGITGMAVDEVTHTVYLLSPDALWRADLPVYVPAI